MEEELERLREGYRKRPDVRYKGAYGPLRQPHHASGVPLDRG